MPRIIGIGRSHVICFNQAAEEMTSRTPDRFQYIPVCFNHPEYHPSFVARDGVMVPNPAWVDVVRRHAGEAYTHVLLVLPGAEWWHWSLTPGPQPFDFIDPRVEDAEPPQGVNIPYDLMLQKARASFRYIGQIVDVVREVSDFRLTLSAPPPPMRRIDVMFDEHANPWVEPGSPTKRLPLLLQQLTPTIEQYGFRTDPFRLKMWRICMRAVSDLCAEKGVAYLPPPPDGVDDGGFLLPDMISDFVHANRKWGVLQLERLLMTLRQPGDAL